MDNQTTSGRRVDGIIQPVAPHVAGHQNDFPYYCYSAVANVLDASAAAFPVSPGFSLAELAPEESLTIPALGAEDAKVQSNCKSIWLTVVCFGTDSLQIERQTRKICPWVFKY